MSHKHDYRQIFKATSLFGGVQGFNILIGFARNKVVTVLLGPEGFGIVNLFNSTISVITSYTSLGLSFSALRNISQANETGDEESFARTIITFRRWMWFSGLLGTVITLLLSPLLSQWTFGSGEYTVSFIWIAFSFLLASQTNARNTMLQGMRKLKLLARANVAGSVLGLLISLPLYYFLGVRGIVPALLASAVAGFILAWYLTRSIAVAPVSLSLRESVFQGMDMVRLGILTTLSASAWYSVNLFVNAYVTRTGGLGELGLYQAGHSLTNQSVNLVFTAMIVDLFPRLAGIQGNVLKERQTVNQQVEVAALLIAPLTLAFVSFLPIAVHIMYTPSFMRITEYVQWYFLGILFKATYWSMGYLIMARGDTRTYIFLELSSCLLFAALATAGYRFFGLQGLGASYLVSHLLFCILYYVIVSRKYQFAFSLTLGVVLLVQTLLSVLLFLCIRWFGYPVATYAGIFICALSGGFSLWQINKRLDLKDLISSRFGKNRERHE